MRSLLKGLLIWLILFGAALTLGAENICLFDPYPLKGVLSPDRDLFLPRAMGTASESLLLGAASAHGELAWFQYSRGLLVLESSGFPSEKTLIRFFLNSLDESVQLPVQDESGGAEISQPFMGGTLYFSRLKPNEVRLITDKKITLTLRDSPGIHTSHFEAGGETFWLGDGNKYFCYDKTGAIRALYNLADMYWDGESRNRAGRDRALLTASFMNGRLCLTLEGAEILFLGGDETDSAIENSYDMAGLFIDFYSAGYEYIRIHRPDLIQSYDQWAAGKVEQLYKEDPLNSELSDLFLLLN